MKGNNFTKSIIALLLSQVMVKIFGVIYTLYLTNKNGFGDKGNAIFMSGYQIYALMLTVSSIGIPNAVSRLIAERKYLGDEKNKEKIFKVTLLIFGCIGITLSICLYVLADFIAVYVLQVSEVVLELKILSPAIFFVSITSVYKGYFNGENKIALTARCQCYEQIVKSILTVIFVEYADILTNNNTEYMAIFANLATTFACVFSYIYCVYKYKNLIKKGKKQVTTNSNFKEEKIKNIVKKILVITLPISFTAIINSFGKNIDSITVVRILKKSIGIDSALEKYGIISSKIDIMTILPLSLNMAIVTALMPELIKNKIKKNNEIENIVNKTVFITIVFGISYAFAVYFYSKNIFLLLFPNAISGFYLLKLSSYNIVFALLVQTYNGIIQGIGENKIPLYACLLGLFVKIVLNIVLININNIQEKGAIISNLFANVISYIMLNIYVSKKLKINLNVISFCIYGIIVGSILIIYSKMIYNFLVNKIANINCSFVITIIFSVIFYIFLIFFVFWCKKEKTPKY